MLEMAKAYDKGISTYEFRKSLMSDLQFIFDMKDAKAKIGEEMKKEKDQEVKVENALRLIRSGSRL